MPKRFHEKLTDLLKSDPRFLDDEGELLRAAVMHRAWRIDHELVKLLLTDTEIKAKFFDEIDGHWVFNFNTFVEYVSSKNFLNDSYTRFRNKIGLTVGDRFLRERGDVSLVWPYKDCVLEGGQTDEETKRKEIFFNEILAQDEIDRLFDPKVLTGWKRYTVDGAQEVSKLRREDGTIRENLLIKGNNLLALHTLKKQFRGKVKLIYIDPPYNTGSDSFRYNDQFKHSSWLTFMKNRLDAARDLLRDDGVIFIHIDDHEMHYLKVVADSIFGQDNFVATLPRKTRHGKTDVPYKLSQDFDWMLIYTNRASKKEPLFQRSVTRKYYSSPDFPDDEWRLMDLTKQTTADDRVNSDFPLVNPRNGQQFPANPNRTWSVTAHTVDDYLRKKKIVFPGDYDFLKIKTPYMRVFKSEEIADKGEDFDKTYVSSHFLNQTMDELMKDMINKKGTDEIVKLHGRKVFNYPKPELLMQRIIEYTTEEGDIVLDFHLGSGTTCAVAHKMRRQWIGVEQMRYLETTTLTRLNEVIGKRVAAEGVSARTLDYDSGGISGSVNWRGGGDFIYCELMRYNQIHIDRIHAAQSSKELVRLWRAIAQYSFLNWYVNPETPDDAVDDFIAIGQRENGLEKQKRCLMDLLNKNQLYVNLSEIDDEDFAVSDHDKSLNQQFYGQTEAPTQQSYEDVL